MIDRFVLLIGAMKAGTTALYQLLRQHPAVAPCREKEPEFLCDPARWQAGLEAYSRLWDWRPGRHRWALEASTNYTKLPAQRSAAPAAWALGGGAGGAAERAEFRFVYLVRHPIARLRSEYLHSLAEGWIRAGVQAGLAPHAVLHSNYRLQLAPYVASHGRERILVLSHAELVADAPGTARRVLDWLGLDAGVRLRDPGPQNTGAEHRGRLLARLRARHPGRGAAALEAELERSITPSAEQVQQVRALLEPDLTLFRQEWGVDPWAERLPARVAAVAR